MRRDVVGLAEQKCPVCSRSRNEWRTNSGRGETKDGTMYCCEGCAKGTSCICELRQTALSPSIDQTPNVTTRSQL